MTRRPFIVVCPETGRADVRTHKDEVDGAYFMSSDHTWRKYAAGTCRGLHAFDSVDYAEAALRSAPPVPADAVLGPEADEPKASPGPTLIASLRDIRIRLENGTINELPQTIVVDVGDGRSVRYYKEGWMNNA